jgi:zinc protease
MTIGYLEDLNRSNVNDLKNFFLRWYGPNNATLTVGGDVTPAQVLNLLDKYSTLFLLFYFYSKNC